MLFKVKSGDINVTINEENHEQAACEAFLQHFVAGIEVSPVVEVVGGGEKKLYSAYDICVKAGFRFED